MRKRRFHIMRPCQRPFLQARRWRRPSNVSLLALALFAWGHASSARRGRCTHAHPRQQHETKADDPMHPPQQKKFAQKQRRRRKRARRGFGPPSRRAPPPTGGGHPARAAGCGAHARASTSLQHHDGSGRDVSNDSSTLSSQSAKGYTFWPSSCSCAPPPLRVRAWYASPLLAPATSLSIIFIACSPLLPRSAPRPSPPTPAFLFHRKRRVFLLTDAGCSRNPPSAKCV
jgi:hypothetical protein